ncbi:UNVERIFIED_CONTAM: putative late blight resistance proteinR1A-10 [Sesamum radiatum]|uniref:Late blight resistance proteinR1A-10 n=1 Tax=Sesamum radiatum TaxID=300843 RepID=A0AAW2MYC8_SESRA
MDALISSFPDDENGSRIMLTTRIEDVAHFATMNKWEWPVSERLSPDRESRDQIVLKVRTKATRHRMLGAGKYLHRVKFLNEKESWHLLREHVFAEGELCPPKLVEPGKKIAEKCEGLPLAIIAVGKHLSKAKRTLDYWTKVAETENSVIIGADEETTKMDLVHKSLAKTSKDFVPKWFKDLLPITLAKTSEDSSMECFKDLKSNSGKTLEDFAKEYLDQLVSRSLVLVRQNSSNSDHGIKTCKTHTTYWHMCVKEAGKDMFFHVINNYANGIRKGVESGRRLCIHNNVLFGIKDVYKSMVSVSNARSLLCTGPHHQYPIPIHFSLRLLRVLDALTIRFYTFPIEVLKLVQLRYLAFTYNKSLPASISKLWNLQYLIVHRQYPSINPSRSRCLPIEIWNMQELRHLEVMGIDLPYPNFATPLLPNLLTLLGISAESCTEEVLGRIANLKRLGIQIELGLDAAQSLSCFDHLSHLYGLQTLKCIVVNPKPSFQVVAPATPPFSVFPSGLKKLTLSGLGLPWEYMSVIAQLPKLEILKLRQYAFQGPVWKVYDSQFLHLKFLLLEDTDLEFWSAGGFSFILLKHLIISHCYKLKDFCTVIRGILSVEMIELVDCSPSLAASAKKILEGRLNPTQLIVSSSEDDGKRKS